jgi:hypothetical protein
VQPWWRGVGGRAPAAPASATKTPDTTAATELPASVSWPLD